jgi:SAM-dependent methyltransferase
MPEPCDICGATRMRSFLDVSLLGTRPASVYRCDACGFRQIRPRLTAQEIKALYPSDYFDSASPIGYADYAREFQRRQREAYFLTRWLKRLGPKGRLLEVGCALGFLLAGLKRSEWHLDGVDASEFAAFYARSRYDLDVTCATLEEAAFPDDTFDVVIQKDLLEHVANPRRHLDETRRLLRPGGWLRLVTPSGEANLRPLVAVSVELGASAAVRPGEVRSSWPVWLEYGAVRQAGRGRRRYRRIVPAVGRANRPGHRAPPQLAQELDPLFLLSPCHEATGHAAGLV